MSTSTSLSLSMKMTLSLSTSTSNDNLTICQKVYFLINQLRKCCHPLNKLNQRPSIKSKSKSKRSCLVTNQKNGTQRSSDNFRVSGWGLRASVCLCVCVCVRVRGHIDGCTCVCVCVLESEREKEREREREREKERETILFWNITSNDWMVNDKLLNSWNCVNTIIWQNDDTRPFFWTQLLLTLRTIVVAPSRSKWWLPKLQGHLLTSIKR